MGLVGYFFEIVFLYIYNNAHFCQWVNYATLLQKEKNYGVWNPFCKALCLNLFEKLYIVIKICQTINQNQSNETRLDSRTRALTRHCDLNMHMSICTFKESVGCRFYHEADESPLHLLTQHWSLMGTYYSTLGRYLPQPGETKTVEAQRILQYFF